MIVTNKRGLPEPVLRALAYDAYRRVGDITITELLKPPQMLELERRHDHGMIVDASDHSAIRRLVGTAVHEYLMRFARTADVIAEERLSAQIEGWTVTGKPDLYELTALDDEGVVTDYKVTSAWALLHGSRDREWSQQLNGYGQLYRLSGFAVRAVRVVAFLPFDWDENRAAKDEDYPQAAGVHYAIELWPEAVAQRFLQRRVALHQRARLNKEWPPCSPEERWQRPTAFAVYAGKRKKALAVFGEGTKRGGGEDEAKALLQELDAKGKAGGRLEIRAGADVRCQRFCYAAPFCPQWAAAREGTAEIEEAR